ncbi:MAG: potassium transporter TrkA [Cyanobacteria bacterium RI_101]|nr:potassium transporter TrkA [Cyanobacteria bacterium RI_101]
MAKKNAKPRSESFLVCGLGSLGQQCVVALKQFGVPIWAIEKNNQDSYEVPDLPDLLDQFIIGDCAYAPILDRLDLQTCRSALLLTSTEPVNIETALLIRQRNPQTRLVVRSSKKNLNELLEGQLGNFIAYDPLDLPAQAFALAALGTDTLGFFELEKQWVRVVQLQLGPNHPWLHNFRLRDLQSRARRLLLHQRVMESCPRSFHLWSADGAPQLGDRLIYLELLDNWSLAPTAEKTAKPGRPLSLNQENPWVQRLQVWQKSLGERPIILWAAAILLGLIALGTTVLHFALPGSYGLSAFYRTAILLLGGYGDVFGDLEEAPENAWILQPVALLLTLTGTAFVGILYALLTEKLIASKFQFIRKRLPIPNQNHIIILGLGRVGQRVVKLLKTWKQPAVGITLSGAIDPRVLPDIPVISDGLQESLDRANLTTASSIVVVTDDDLLNLEVALMAERQNPSAHLVIRTGKEGLSQSLMGLLPRAHVLETYRLAAEVFVGAAFGENILHLFRLPGQTVLVTEYQIEPQDTLCGLLLGEVAYGYGVIPILYQAPGQESRLLPSDDLALKAGDRLIILASIDSLKRIEIRDLAPKTWRIRIEKLALAESDFEGANILSRISGCSLQQARQAMANPPQILTTPLYRPQGERLLRALQKIQVKAALIPLGAESQPAEPVP